MKTFSRPGISGQSIPPDASPLETAEYVSVEVQMLGGNKHPVTGNTVAGGFVGHSIDGISVRNLRSAGGTLRDRDIGFIRFRRIRDR